MTTIDRPADTEYAPFYVGYVNGVPEGDVVAYLELQGRELVDALQGVDEAHGDFRPAPGKWSLKEVLGHVSDAERVFAYRALRFARGDRTPLASFDQDAYVAAAHFDQRALADLIDEFGSTRAATLRFVRSLTAEESRRAGTASSAGISVRALVYVIAGHARHHARAISERYVKQ